MTVFLDAVRYVVEHREQFQTALWEHVRLSAASLLLAMLLFIPLGIVASRGRRVGPALVAAIGGVRVVPSLAVLFLLLPLLGTGFTPALVALTLLAASPLVVNTDAGLRGVDPAIRESAQGLGLSGRQVFFRVELLLALPVIVAGVRTAAIEVVASATLAAFIGAGGLGAFILSGMSLIDYPLLLVGAVPVAVLALLIETLLHRLEQVVTPPAA
jgi:osmoprotectant transport system permease protein